MKLSKISLFMEKVWLAIALASFLFWIYKSYMTTMFDSRYFLFASVFALAFFFVRQGLRKSIERKEKERKERGN